MSIPVLAEKSSASNGLNTADANIHSNLGLGSPQDLNFYIGTCNGGHSTAVLDTIGACVSGRPNPKPIPLSAALGHE